NYIYQIDSEIYVATRNGLYKYDKDSDRFEPDPLFGEKYAGKEIEITRVEEGSNNDIWLSLINADGSYGVVRLVKKDDGYEEVSIPFNRLPDRTTDMIYAEGEGPVWIGVSDKIFTFDTKFIRDYDELFHSLTLSVVIGQDSLLFGGTNYSISEDGETRITLTQDRDQRPGIKYRYNNISFRWASPYFDGEEKMQYSFRLLGFDEDWTRWSDRTEFTYTNLPNKSLVFEVRSRNIYGVESSYAQYAFTILPPWYKTILAYFMYVITAFILIVVIVKLYTRRLQLEKVRLEGIVARRTAEVVRQKEELEDSITYASRIQRAILPSEKILNEHLPEHFLFFKPRDIVSGDFYWMTSRGDNIMIVAADCTGHGVPGAFMSLLGISFLNEIVNRLDILRSDEILNHLRQEIMSSLKQTGKDDEAKDGMDVAICIIDKKKMKAQFSGAYNPLWLVRPLTKNELIQVEKGNDLEFPPRSIHDQRNVLIPFVGDKMPIGISVKGVLPFTANELEIKKGYSIYLFSDGYVDQFGGPNGKKFMSKAFKKLILDIQDQPMSKQEKILDERFEEWKGDLDQVDDILVIGLKID
ncbi:MAG: SpoIIE family protein phosphatase, partial [Bacteroidota bacterium]|nr:SpoIIE family protein phosphatase [Bacteroidota bacterium]